MSGSLQLAIEEPVDPLPAVVVGRRVEVVASAVGEAVADAGVDHDLEGTIAGPGRFRVERAQLVDVLQ